MDHPASGERQRQSTPAEAGSVVSIDDDCVAPLYFFGRATLMPATAS